MDSTGKSRIESGDPVLKQTYKGHKDVVQSLSFHPNMYE
jgi:hypothetical protein